MGITIAIGVPAPTVTGHVAEDQDLTFAAFREGAPGSSGAAVKLVSHASQAYLYNQWTEGRHPSEADINLHTTASQNKPFQHIRIFSIAIGFCKTQ